MLGAMGLQRRRGKRERGETVWDQKSYGRTMKIRSGSKRATVVIEAQLREH